MGITKSDCNILFHVKKKLEVSFSNTLMLGRLHLFASKKEINNLIANHQLIDKIDLSKLEENLEYSEPVFRMLGAETVDSLDYSDYEGANIIHDLNQPIASEYHNKYTAVVDGGTIEHVFNFPIAIQNAINLIQVGGYYIGITPVNNQMGHGFYQFSPELYYRIFSSQNGFKVAQMLIRAGEELYEVSDPDKVKSRVQLTDGLPATLIVIAKKIEFKSKFITPQQSDYANSWAVADTIKSGIPREGDSKVLHLYRRMIPNKLKTIIKKVYYIFKEEELETKALGNINPQHFKKIELMSSDIESK